MGIYQYNVYGAIDYILCSGSLPAILDTLVDVL